MSTLKLPVFTPTAAKLWAKLSIEDKKDILENVFCGQCKGTTTMFNASGKAERGALVLNGLCAVAVCLGQVGRFVEAGWFA